MRPLAALPAVLLFAALWVRPAPPRQPVVVLISLDTVRADHLGIYGATDDVTPHLDALAADAVVFDRAIAPAPTTLASHTSLMTGTWPHTHGVPRNGFVVHADNVTLAERLAAAGWETVGVVGSVPLAAETGFDQGFGHYDDEMAVTSAGVRYYERHGEIVVNRALRRLDRRDPTRPLFLFVHLYDAHAP